MNGCSIDLNDQSFLYQNEKFPMIIVIVGVITLCRFVDPFVRSVACSTRSKLEANKTRKKTDELFRATYWHYHNSRCHTITYCRRLFAAVVIIESAYLCASDRRNSDRRMLERNKGARRSMK